MGARITQAEFLKHIARSDGRTRGARGSFRVARPVDFLVVPVKFWLDGPDPALRDMSLLY